uniref:IgGFc-binding protein N-terminal domain-containing protein n=1 Tax=Biomphalaria glabrata TaxID=6526 RepID=A0A2C9KBY0_BIOGL
MLFPISEYATKFIVTKPVKFEGHLKIVVAKAKTQISIDGLTISKNFTSQRDLELISFEKEKMVGPHFIMSTGAITVAFFVITTCKSNSYVEIASTIFVPTGLYMDNYYWTIYKEETTKNYLLMIARTGDLEFVYINGYQMESSAKNVCTLLNYTSYQNKDRSKRKAGMWLSLDYQLLLDGYHQLYNKNGLRLSVFLYGQRDRATYIYPAGFIVPPKSLSTCGDTTSGHTEGDLIDNDCDGYIDEEERDHEDDDGDDRIDEDKGKSPLTNGYWADWKGWQCESTFATTAHRNRYCDDPPPYNGGMPCSGSDMDVLSNINCTNIESAVIVNPSRLIEAIHCHLRPDRVITAYIEWSCYDLSGYGNLRCQSHPPLYLINKDCFTCSDILRRQFNWLRYSDSDVYGNTIHSTARRCSQHNVRYILENTQVPQHIAYYRNSHDRYSRFGFCKWLDHHFDKTFHR